MTEVGPETTQTPRRGSIFSGRISNALGFVKQAKADSPKVSPEDPAEVEVRPGVDINEALSIFNMRALKDVSPAERNMVIANLEPIAFEPKAVVIEQGESDIPPRLIFFIKGGIEILVTSNGTTKSVRKMRSPFYVGEGRILDKSATSNNATVQCQDGPCKGFVLSRESCDVLIQDDSQVLRSIERDMKIRAFERELQSGKGLFQELIKEPLFMSWMMVYANRIIATETILFTLAVTELKNLGEIREYYAKKEAATAVEGITTDVVAGGAVAADDEPVSPTRPPRMSTDTAREPPESLDEVTARIHEQCEEIWHTHIEVPEDEGTAHTLMISLSGDERIALTEQRAQLQAQAAEAAGGAAPIDSYLELYDVPLKGCHKTIRQSIVPGFMQGEEYASLMDELYPIVKPRRRTAESLDHAPNSGRRKSASGIAPQSS